MLLSEVVVTVILAATIAGAVVAAIFERELQYLRRENRMLWRLLSDQARLREMSLDAYIAMLREAQRHTNNQHF